MVVATPWHSDYTNVVGNSSSTSGRGSRTLNGSALLIKVSTKTYRKCLTAGTMEDQPLTMGDGMGPRNGCFPFGFWREAYALFRLAWPTSLSILFHYMIQPISIAFCGHLGTQQLAGVAMAMSVIYITCVSIGRGLAFGSDTFFSQSYGSRNKKMVGVYLQRAIVFGLLACCPICAILLNVESILLLLDQDPVVVTLAQEYIFYFLPGVLAYCWLFILMRYLLCQNRVLPNLIVCVISCAVNAILHYGLVVQAQMGIRGSAIALAITYYLVLIQLIAYIWGSGVYVETWDGWTWDILKEWGQFARITFSNIGMIFIYWLCTESGTFLSGILGEKEISAYSITFQVEGFVWMIPLGLGGACTARVGQFLGANQPMRAMTTCRVAVTIQMMLSASMAVAAYVLRVYIPMAFTTDSNLISYTAGLLQVVAVFVFFEGIGGVGVCVIQGTGRQTLGAIIIFISYYAVALPVGISLMFATRLGLYGLWMGYVFGLALQDVLLLIFMARLDWDKEAAKAQVRAGVSPPIDSVNTDGSTTEYDAQSHPDETTTLLPPAEGVTLVSPSLSWKQIILRRLSVLLLFLLTLLAGILCHQYVHVKTR